MNHGKTSWAEAILGETIEWLVRRQGLDESEIAYVYAEAVDIQTIVRELGSSLDLGKIYYLFIFSDDAAASEGQHGRRASSKENVQVSQFYIRYEIRRRYGYARAITAVHVTQVYHLIDKTFREASDIDVVKALPKSEADRKAIARLMAPEYVPAVFSLLRRLGRQRLLAKSLREFLEAIYTAVVILDGVPYVVKAYQDPERIAEETTEKKQWLRRVQYLRLAQGEREEGAARHGEFNGSGLADAQRHSGAEDGGAQAHGAAARRGLRLQAEQALPTGPQARRLRRILGPREALDRGQRLTGIRAAVNLLQVFPMVAVEYLPQVAAF